MLDLLAVASVLAATAAYNTEPFYTPEKPYSQRMSDAHNLLKYTGWQGPYSDRRGYGINRDPPSGCKVDQVVQLTRHGERWPDEYDFDQQAEALAKVEQLKGSLTGSLAFANAWEPYTYINSPWNGEESLIGPYSGLLHGYRMGVEARRRYYELYDGQSTLPLFSSGYERIVNTARKFGEGFLGWNYTDLAAVNIFPETAEAGANSLVPVCKIENDYVTTCALPQNSTMENGAPWIYAEYESAAVRLNNENPGLNLTAADIPQLIAVVAFELNTRGSSPWAQVFRAEEYIAFEYAQSSLYFCSEGPGSSTGLLKGSVFLNASRTVLVQGPEENRPLNFAFAHDTDIIHLITALGVDTPATEWNAEEVQFGQRWDVTDLTPQGAHITFERLVCEPPAQFGDALYDESQWSNIYPAAFNTTGNFTPVYASNASYAYNGTNSSQVLKPDLTAANTTNSTDSSAPGGSENIYVRIVLNEAVVPLPGCAQGPGKSCKLSDYNNYVDTRLAGVNYAESCGLPQNAPTYPTFFWNFSTSNALNADSAVLPAQAGKLDAQGQPLQS